MSRLTELDAFFTDHDLCDELDTGAEEPVIWFACGRGATLARRVDEAAADATQPISAQSPAEEGLSDFD